MHPNTISLTLKRVNIHGNTRSFAQIFGRKPRCKSYNAEDLQIFIKILYAFPGIAKREMRYLLYFGTRKIFI